MSIKKSLRIAFILISIIPVIVVSFVAHRLLNQKLMSVQTQNLQQIAQTNSSGLESMIEIQRTEMSLLSEQEDVKDFLIAQATYKKLRNTEMLDNLLLNRQKRYASCEIISLYNSAQEVIASSNPEMIGKKADDNVTLSYILGTKNIAVGVSGVRRLYTSNHTPIYCIEIGSPILDDRSTTPKIIGYIVSTIRVTYFNEFLNSIDVGDTGLGMLLDIYGNIIYHPNSSQIGNPISSDRLASIVSDYNRGDIPKHGTFEYTIRNTKKAFGYCIIPELNWVLLVSQDVNEINTVSNLMLCLLLVICAVLMVIMVILGSNISKKFTNPIIELRDAMRTASDGNLTVQSNIRSQNELGELSKSFNKMLHIIKSNYDDLASMHDELLSNEEQLRSNYDHIEFLAYHDVLTNLPNKLSFLDHVNAALMSPSCTRQIHAVYFVDLDNFKTINDTLGHEYGDALLIKTAQMLSSVLGNDGILARAGGDEFLIFREDITSKEEAMEFASTMLDCFKAPLDIEGEIVYISMSIGISVYPENGLTPNALIKNADIAMYRSKDTGRNKFTLFDRKMEEELSRNALILEVLRNVIENNELYIQYQPLIELETGSVTGYEALMRINSMRLGYLSPAEFIPIAEESGLIIELSSWMLKEACRFNKELIDLGYQAKPVSVNISSIQINRPGFVSTLSDILEETKLPPQYLEIEITESTLVSSLMDATMLLTSLQCLGVRVSLDDFGTGYSSLNYLTKMPIDTLKIDKSFVDNICASEKDARIAESIILLAHSLDIRVVAEGVEHLNQLELLKSKKCDVVQGYIFSRPLHPAALMDLINNTRVIDTSFSLF